jgi:hypothetical protein
VTVVNVKPADRLSHSRVAEALTWVGELFADRGWHHEVWSTEQPTRMANIRFLAGFRDRRRVDTDAVEAVRGEVEPVVSLGEAERRLSVGRQRELVRPALLHLLWCGEFFSHLHLYGGPAPVRRFLPQLIDLIWNRQIDPGKVFDLTLPLDQAADAYKAMDERRAIKALLRPRPPSKTGGV